MKKALVGIVAVGFLTALASTGLAEEMKEQVKVKETKEGVKVTEKVKGEEMKSKTTTEVKEGDEAVEVKKTEKVKTADTKAEVKKDVVLTEEGAAADVKIKGKEKGVGKVKMEAAGVETVEGEKAAAAKVTMKRKGKKKEVVQFESYNQDNMTITVVKGGAKVEMPTRENDRWSVKPDAMKKGQEITIYSTYDPRLIKHVVEDVEAKVTETK